MTTQYHCLDSKTVSIIDKSENELGSFSEMSSQHSNSNFVVGILNQCTLFDRNSNNSCSRRFKDRWVEFEQNNPLKGHRQVWPWCARNFIFLCVAAVEIFIQPFIMFDIFSFFYHESSLFSIKINCGRAPENCDISWVLQYFYGNRNNLLCSVHRNQQNNRK